MLTSVLNSKCLQFYIVYFFIFAWFIWPTDWFVFQWHEFILCLKQVLNMYLPKIYQLLNCHSNGDLCYNGMMSILLLLKCTFRCRFYGYQWNQMSDVLHLIKCSLKCQFAVKKCKYSCHLDAILLWRKCLLKYLAVLLKCLTQEVGSLLFVIVKTNGWVAFGFITLLWITQ